MTLKKFNKKFGIVTPKKECAKCHSFFIPDDNEDCCIFCMQSPEEEKQVIKEKKMRARMKANGI